MRVPTLIIALFLTAATQSAAEPLRIGLSLGLSGKYAEMSLMQRRGYTLWRRHVNESGGLLGRPVQLIVKDDRSRPEQAARIYRKLITEDRIDLLFAPYSSAVTASAAEVAEAHEYPLLADGASADSLWTGDRRYLFGVYTTARDYAMGFLEMLLRRGVTRIAIVGADDNFSRSIAQGTRTWAERFGFRLAAFHTFAKGTADLVPVARAAGESGAEALVVCGHFDEAVGMRRALAAAGWRPRAYFASVGPVLPSYGDQLGDLAEGTFSSAQWEVLSADKFPGGAKFLAQFREAFGMDPSYHAASAYAAGQILAKAVARAGTLDRPRIRDILSRLDTMTIIGRYGVDRTGLQIRHFPLIIQWRQGVKEVVWPEEFRTSEPSFQ